MKRNGEERRALNSQICSYCASPNILSLIKKLILREVKESIHNHTASTLQSWDSESNPSNSSICAVSPCTLGPPWVSTEKSNRKECGKHKIWGPSKTLAPSLFTSLFHARCALVINASDALGVSRWYAIYSTQMGNFKMVFFNRLATKCCQKTQIVQAILRPNSRFYPAFLPRVNWCS